MQTDPTNAPRNRPISMQEVKARTGISRPQVYKLIRSGDPALRFPAPVKIGRASRWSEAEVSAWIERQEARRPAAA